MYFYIMTGAVQYGEENVINVFVSIKLRGEIHSNAPWDTLIHVVLR